VTPARRLVRNNHCLETVSWDGINLRAANLAEASV
jgi:hypothetical protein